MTFSLKNTGISIDAKTHNPSILSKEWLSRKKIIQEKEIKDFANTPVFSLIETDDFQFIVHGMRLDITPKNTDSGSISRTLEIIKKYVKELPETPYTELKFRFLYEVSSNLEYLKELFAKNEKLLNKIFPKDYEIGGIIEFRSGKFLIRIMLIPTDNIVEASFLCDQELKVFKELQEGLEEYFNLKEQVEKVLEGLF